MARKRPGFFRRVQSLQRQANFVRRHRSALLITLLIVFALIFNPLLGTAVSPAATANFGLGFTGETSKSSAAQAANSLRSATLMLTETQEQPSHPKSDPPSPPLPGGRQNPKSSANALQLVQQGRTLYEAGRFSEAVTIWQQAASALSAQKDVLNQAMVLSNLASAFLALGQWEDAKGAIASSWRLLQANQDAGESKERLRTIAQALNTQGNLQLALGQAEQALSTWQQAATTYERVGDDVGMTRSLINQAQALQALGLYRRAETILTETTQLLEKQPDSPMKTSGLRSLGNTLRLVGDLEKSHQMLQQSLALAVRLKSLHDISAALFSLGNTAQAQHDNEAALQFYQQADSASSEPTTKIQAQLNQLSLLLEMGQASAAVALWPKIQSEIANLPPSRTAIYARIDLAQSLMKLRILGKTQDCALLLATAIQQAKSLGDQRALSYALGNLGSLYEQNQQLSDAQDVTQQALIVAQALNAPDIAYRWQWQLGRLLKAQGRNNDAIAAYTETVTTLQALRSDLVAINPEIQFSFRDEVEPVYRQFVDLLLRREGTTDPSQENLKRARQTIESLQLAELDNFFRVACLEGKPVQIDQVIDKDDPTAAVIYPIILADRLEVILKLPQKLLRHYKTPISQSEVEKILEDLGKKILLPYEASNSNFLLKQVYDWLLKPAEADLESSHIKTLVFVLDGSLRNIPMAALYDGQKYLIQKYGVALTPGLQLLSPKSLSHVKLKALAAGLSEARPGFSALANVTVELQQIVSQVPSTILLNQEFTKTTFEQEINAVPFPVVHIATHGIFSSKVEETFILTWEGRLNVIELNNLLRNRNQSRTSPIELLVLSACQTAAGDKRATLGIAGVAVRAGSRSTIASLWNVDDRSTALLMSQFYRELANNQLNKAEALRQAQLVLLKTPKYHRPIYWAPYILVGNWL